MRLWVFITFLFLDILGNAQGAGRWSRTGNLNEWRSGFEFAGLTDGRGMILGGDEYLDSYEIFNPATGTWVLDPLPVTDGTHSHNMAMLLPNGNVLFIPSGGFWLYDPRTDSWTSSKVSIGWEIQSCATLLKDGDVLLMYNSKDCQLYHYATDAATPVGATQAVHSRAPEVLLPDGKVLIIGGYDEPWWGNVHKICEYYNPSKRRWYTKDPLLEARGVNVAVLLPPPWQKVLVAGPKNKCELYDIGEDTWSYTDSLSDYPKSVPAMALLPSGKALMIGGGDEENKVKCELYDPATETWSRTDDTEEPRNHFSAAILPTGKVLIAGSHELGEGWGGFRCEIYDPANGAWTGKPDLNVARATHTTTPLPIIPTLNCSTNVLIVGGENSGVALKSCELYNYSLDNVSITGELTEARSHHTAVLLVDSRVLVAGGKNGGALSSSEAYTIGKPGIWAPAGNMTDARFDHSATMLKNGDVLVTGGEDAGTYLSSCEIYDGGSWTTTNPMATSRARHSAILLRNGNILVIGGQTSTGAINTCELWNGTNWTGSPSMSTARYWHTATLLQSGKVLVAGGTSDGTSGLSSYEIFDPDSNKWFPEGNLNTARFQHNTTVLYSGLVLAIGGNGGINSCETYDPATYKWTTDYTGTLITGRSYHSSVLIPDTMPFILAIGGKDGGGGYLRSIEEYDVGLEYKQIWQSEITNYQGVTLISDPMDITGTLFRGVSEADGGNYCHIANNDHPIISLVRVGGGNWQGNGGGEIMYMPLSSYWDTANTTVHLPTDAPAGYYRLWSIVNGIPCKWYKPCPPSGVEEKTDIRQKATGISVSVFPNPATENIVFKFSHDAGFTMQGSRLTIHDISGRLVCSLPIHDSRLTVNEVTWDGRDSQGRKVNSGVYFYSVKYKDSGAKGKFVILK